MFDPTGLRDQARTASVTAIGCRLLADDIERRRLLLGQRIEPVRVYHQPEVWDSAAADVSREQLARYISGGLWFVGVDLADTVRRLQDEAVELDGRARRLTETAVELEAVAVERAALDPPGNIADGVLDPPIGSSLPTSDVR